MLPAPLTLRALVTLAAKYGLWALLACYLIWKGTDAWAAQLQRVEDTLRLHNEQMMQADLERSQREELQLRFLYAICLGVNRDRGGAEFCGVVK